MYSQTVFRETKEKRNEKISRDTERCGIVKGTSLTCSKEEEMHFRTSHGNRHTTRSVMTEAETCRQTERQAAVRKERAHAYA